MERERVIEVLSATIALRMVLLCAPAPFRWRDGILQRKLVVVVCWLPRRLLVVGLLVVGLLDRRVAAPKNNWRHRDVLGPQGR